MVHSAFRENDKYEYSRKSDLYLSNNRIYETYFIHTSGRYEGDTKVHVIGFQIKPSFECTYMSCEVHDRLIDSCCWHNWFSDPGESQQLQFSDVSSQAVKLGVTLIQSAVGAFVKNF